VLIVGSGLELGSWAAVAGNVIVLASALVWAANTIQCRRLGADHPPMVSTTVSFITGSVLLVPFQRSSSPSSAHPHQRPACSLRLYLGPGRSP
jgi:drug/metabolite transporter (DMT)-like permease